MPANPQRSAGPDTPTTVTPLCAWCRMHLAENGDYCCELHREAHTQGWPHPTPKPYTYDDGHGHCVWCAYPLRHPDCCGGNHPDARSLTAQLDRLNLTPIMFGVAR